jgi:biopolymer transport protein ExbD
VAFDEIEGLLLTETKKIGDNTVIVRIPFDLQVQDLVDLLQIGMKNDLKVIIATEASK